MSSVDSGPPATAPDVRRAGAGGSRLRRTIAAAAALLLALAGFGLAIAAFRGRSHRPPGASSASSKIAFASYAGHWQIFTVNPDGADMHRLTDLPTDQFHPAWSPNGTRIAFDAQSQGGPFEIDVMNARDPRSPRATCGLGGHRVAVVPRSGRRAIGKIFGGGRLSGGSWCGVGRPGSGGPDQGGEEANGLGGLVWAEDVA